MQYELRTQVIEPRRKTFDHLVRRYGDRPASRYEEGTIDIQAKENFHFRPTWDPSKEIYDEGFSVFRLTDAYSFTDPRQYYYAPYVTARAHMYDAFGETLDYLEARDMFGRMPEAWRTLLAEVVIPLRHAESGYQIVMADVARFGFGTTITQCAAYSAFDRIGNAQLLSRVGIALGGGTADLLASGKQLWLDDEALQPMRKYVEELLIERDWGKLLVGVDMLDQVVYSLLYNHLDEAALMGGAGPYSLIAQHLAGWFKDQRKWVDALYKAWTVDPELGDANKALLGEIAGSYLAKAVAAVQPLAAKADQLVNAGCVDAIAAQANSTREALSALGCDVKEG